MYLNKENIEPVLRQGDILTDVHLLGALTINNIRYLTDQQEKQQSWQYNEKPVYGAAMVLSHSCEIDLANDVKLTSIILAPIRDVSKATHPDKVKELIESNELSEYSQFSYLKYFFIHPFPELDFAQGGVVDFSKCFSIRNKSYEYLQSKKVCQLTESYSQSMAIKLAAYYYRKASA